MEQNYIPEAHEKSSPNLLSSKPATVYNIKKASIKSRSLCAVGANAWGAAMGI
jgi:hypothetical protein